MPCALKLLQVAPTSVDFYQRDMHLNPSALPDVIRLLERPSAAPARGDILETAQTRSLSCCEFRGLEW